MTRTRVISGILIFSFYPYAFAAEAINLKHLSFKTVLQNSDPALIETKRMTDFNGATHIRMQQTYAGYPVWGSDIILHYPKDLLNAPKMQGIIYLNLKKDLPKKIPNEENKALESVLLHYQNKKGFKPEYTNLQSKIIIFVKNTQANYAYSIQFDVTPIHAIPERWHYIVDASNYQIDKYWNEIETNAVNIVSMGGYGGNVHMGEQLYDGLIEHHPAFTVQRDPINTFCVLKNDLVSVWDKNSTSTNPSGFICLLKNSEHNNLYWDNYFHQVNGAYSPDNDAFFAGTVINDLYQKWYGVPPLLNANGKPLPLTMLVHDDTENAYFDGRKMVFGDGGDYLYPLTTLDVAAHEISHGFTMQHSNLVYDGQSGGINESFSDIACAAAEYFVTGKNRWRIGADLIKNPSLFCEDSNDCALRYLDNPPRDGRSIDNLKDYNSVPEHETEVHKSSGIFNKAFYLLASTPSWNTKKAFNVWVQANSYYWTPTSDFNEGGCGLIQAAEDYHYAIADVKKALNKVGVNYQDC